MMITRWRGYLTDVNNRKIFNWSSQYILDDDAVKRPVLETVRIDVVK